MERMLVSEYIALQADEQKPKTVKALMGMYVLELMGKANLTAEISYDEFFDSLLDTECVRRDGYVTLAPDWSKDRIFQKIISIHAPREGSDRIGRKTVSFKKSEARHESEI